MGGLLHEVTMLARGWLAGKAVVAGVGAICAAIPLIGKERAGVLADEWIEQCLGMAGLKASVHTDLLHQLDNPTSRDRGNAQATYQVAPPTASVVVLYTPGTGCAAVQAVYSTYEAAQAHINACEVYPAGAYDIEAHVLDVPPERGA